MNEKADRMINNLTPEIARKCEELRAARKERFLSRLFIFMCAAVVLIPSLLVFIGVSLTVLVAPPIFMSFSVVLLLPALVRGRDAEKGVSVYE